MRGKPRRHVRPAPTPGIAADLPEVTWDEVQDIARALLAPHDVGSKPSALAMAELLGQVEGRRIIAPGHDHQHRIVELGVVAGGGRLEIDVRVDPCP